MIAITANSLTKIYRSGVFRREQVRALDDFSIEIQSGEIFSLLGPNGAGKTTFVKILLSVSRPTSGKCNVLGCDLPNVGVKARVGYLPENHRYPGYLTGEQALRFFGELSDVPRHDLASRIPKLMALAGIAQWGRMRVKKYSKGMMQRLGLAQALVNDPEVLFLDEPTDGVDPVGRKEIRDILKDLKARGKTIFLNSHLLSEVELISDRVAILDKGKLLKVGTVDELTSTGSQYQIGLGSPLPDAKKSVLAAKGLRWSSDHASLLVECPTVPKLNSVIDLLRSEGIEIASVIRQRSSLEESFINLIKREVAE